MIDIVLRRDGASLRMARINTHIERPVDASKAVHIQIDDEGSVRIFQTTLLADDMPRKGS